MLHPTKADGPYGAKLTTDRPFAAGDLILRIAGYRVTKVPTFQTIQISRHEHIEELGHLAFTNHSCWPTTTLDVSEMTVTAARDVAAGEELTFFYPSTEWKLERPFVCLCGSWQCIRLVAGARYLSVDALSRQFINEHIRELVQECLTRPVGSALPVPSSRALPDRRLRPAAYDRRSQT